MSTKRRRSWTRLALTSGAVAAITTAVTLAFALSSATATTERTVEVPAIEKWTDSGVALASGEKVTISATGTASWGGGKFTGPVGKKFAQDNCGEIAYEASATEPFTAPGVNCYALLFRVGTSGVPFPTGAKITFTSPVAGELYLGMNDTHFNDNVGHWTATITTP
jgi:hypothetical protein